MINLDTLAQIIEQYKLKFPVIHREEIYKWKAVKHFQNHWDADAQDFKEMILEALDETRMLMDSSSYYPKEMLTNYLNAEPETCRNIFAGLYDQSLPLADRVHGFLGAIQALKTKYTPELNSFQDPRAAFVYLNLKYPENYFLYKFEMFKDFARLLAYPYPINRRHKVENAVLFQDLCEIVLQQVIKDDDLIKLHHQRLQSEHYADPAYHLLTQDIIYAATRYFTALVAPEQPFNIEEMKGEVIEATEHTHKLTGRQVDYAQKAASQKWLGDLGEQAILQYERKRLADAGINNKKPEPVSKTKGDGLGFDILSYDLDEEPIYIEVKTTRSLHAGFYITEPELQKSKEEKDRYRLYRLYDFNEKKRSAKLIVRRGSLEELCINPIAYYVPSP